MRLILAGLAAVALVVGGALSRSRDADAQAIPSNFVFELSCNAQLDTTAWFAGPEAGELVSQFGSIPDQFWIDLSLFDNNFAARTFIGAGPFVAPTQFAWQHLRPASTHYYRLNGLFDGRWMEIGRGSFTSPDCGFITSFSCGSAAESNVVHFAVPPASPIPGLTPVAQWIDLTLFSSPINGELDDGFPPGTFVGAGPFSPGGGEFDWAGIVSQRRHHYRVNTLYTLRSGEDPRWVEQFSGSFTPLDCRALPSYQLPL